jgi:hypothetical protein
MSNETKVAKSNSLKELGYKIVSTSGKDSKGNELIAKVTGPAPVYFVKQTKRGRLIATKEKDSVVESTIEGLYDFKAQNDDLVGRRAGSQAAEKSATPATEPEPVTAAA